MDPGNLLGGAYGMMMTGGRGVSGSGGGLRGGFGPQGERPFGSSIPGSGHHWSDQYRSPHGNSMLMSTADFDEYYGLDPNSDTYTMDKSALLSRAPNANEREKISNALGIESLNKKGLWERTQRIGTWEEEGTGIYFKTYGIIRLGSGKASGGNNQGLSNDLSYVGLTLSTFETGVEALQSTSNRLLQVVTNANGADKVLKIAKSSAARGGFVTAGASIAVNAVDVADGNLSPQRFTFRTGATITGVGIAYFGTAGLGLLATGVGIMAEEAYDSWVNNVLPAMRTAMPTGNWSGFRGFR